MMPETFEDDSPLVKLPISCGFSPSVLWSGPLEANTLTQLTAGTTGQSSAQQMSVVSCDAHWHSLSDTETLSDAKSTLTFDDFQHGVCVFGKVSL